MDDNKIVGLYLLRDESAIIHTAEKYGKRIRALSQNIVADYQTAEECENDTYNEVWRLIPPNEPREYLYPFIARIVRHISLDFCRKRNALKRQAYIVDLSEELDECIPSSFSTEEVIDDIFLKEAINGFLKALDSEKRKIFMQRYWYLDEIKSIAKRFSMSESNVKVILHRCRQMLKKYLEKEGYTV